MPSPSKGAESTKEKESPEPLLARGSDRLVLNPGEIRELELPELQFGSDVLQAVEKARAAAQSPAATPDNRLLVQCKLSPGTHLVCSTRWRSCSGVRVSIRTRRSECGRVRRCSIVPYQCIGSKASKKRQKKQALYTRLIGLEAPNASSPLLRPAALMHAPFCMDHSRQVEGFSV